MKRSQCISTELNYEIIMSGIKILNTQIQRQREIFCSYLISTDPWRQGKNNTQFPSYQLYCSNDCEMGGYTRAVSGQRLGKHVHAATSLRAIIRGVPT
jgi:hypothetical protein